MSKKCRNQTCIYKVNRMKGILRIPVTWWWRYYFLDWLYWMQIRFAGWYFTLRLKFYIKHKSKISKSKYLKLQHIQTKITCFDLFIYLIIIWKSHNESLLLFTQCHFGESPRKTFVNSYIRWIMDKNEMHWLHIFYTFIYTSF